MSSIPTLNAAIARKPTATTGRTGEVKAAERPKTSLFSTTKKPVADKSGSQKSAFQQERWLVDIPQSALNEHSAWLSAGTWHGMFDCAMWLRTPSGLTTPVQLALKYIDNSGEKTLLIDRCFAGAHRTVLLNGSINMTISGRVRDIGFYLLGATDGDILLEEWHFTPQHRRAR